MERNAAQDSRGPRTPRGENAVTWLSWVPGVVLAVACVVLNLRLRTASDVLAGASIMTGFLFGFVLFAFQLRLRVTDDAHLPKFGSLRGLLNRAFARGVQAVVVSLGTTVLAVIGNNFVRAASAGGETHLNRYWTAVLALFGLRLVALVLMAVYDLYRAYVQIPG